MNWNTKHDIICNLEIYEKKIIHQLSTVNCLYIEQPAIDVLMK